mmetsp:Transcript_7928/g.17745  ORF Transcript_7928/g.17745 Transcript_7928/m.17745 type:complete len:129 (-) Transcript_7928:5-391(-)
MVSTDVGVSPAKSTAPSSGDESAVQRGTEDKATAAVLTGSAAGANASVGTASMGTARDASTAATGSLVDANTSGGAPQEWFPCELSGDTDGGGSDGHEPHSLWSLFRDRADDGLAALASGDATGCQNS